MVGGDASCPLSLFFFLLFFILFSLHHTHIYILALAKYFIIVKPLIWHPVSSSNLMVSCSPHFVPCYSQDRTSVACKVTLYMTHLFLKHNIHTYIYIYTYIHTCYDSQVNQITHYMHKQTFNHPWKRKTGVSVLVTLGHIHLYRLLSWNSYKRVQLQLFSLSLSLPLSLTTALACEWINCID